MMNRRDQAEMLTAGATEDIAQGQFDARCIERENLAI